MKSQQCNDSLSAQRLPQRKKKSPLRNPRRNGPEGVCETGECSIRSASATKERQTMHTAILVLIAALSLSFAPATAWAQPKVDPLTIKFAHAGSSTHPYSVGINVLTPILEKNSGGAIKLQVFC